MNSKYLLYNLFVEHPVRFPIKIIEINDQDLLAKDLIGQGTFTQTGIIPKRGIRPVFEFGYQPGFQRILMNIMEAGEAVYVFIFRITQAFEFSILGKQRAGTILLLIDRLAVRAQQVAEPFTERITFDGVVTDFSDGMLIGINQKMKMVGHEGIGQQVALRRKVFTKFTKKIQIILWLEENRLSVVAPIVNVVDLPFL